ncbi:ParB/RepB/Spo0J family partition protein [uncultured Enterovirga sp.]|uniref:ParB/RepB/Spo0J family partition protein n=1 Tax=uncultured Enterovirga sp. TaxID=2026352 RepID=UPI0035CC351A
MSKIMLNGVSDVPLNKLIRSQANVRRIKAGVSIEDLAEDIARRGLIQSLAVRPVLDGEGQETGMYEVPAGGRRFEALKLLAKQKRLSKTVRVPCIVRTDGIGAEDSLAENTMREALHPLDQFRAFQALREEHGLCDEEIAARFFVTPAVVRQRLKLVAASPKLLDLYAAGELSLEQLMAFCVSSDHARQEAVWEALKRGYNTEPYYIRRLLTEGAVKASDKRAVFVGAAAYEDAGGVIERDLFHEDGGGYFRDVALLDRLVAEKVETQADVVRAEGWKWIEVAAEHPYGRTFALRRLYPATEPMSETEQAEREALQTEYDDLEAEHAAAPELPEEVDARLGEIEAALARLDERPALFEHNEIARAGAFVSLDVTGQLKVERGFVRPEDEKPVEPEADIARADGEARGGDEPASDVPSPATATSHADFDEEEDPSGRVSDRLLTELTAARTLSLRAALANDPDAAFLAVLHALTLRTFCGSYSVDTCLDIEARSVPLGSHAPGLDDSPAGQALTKLHEDWSRQMPSQATGVWAFVLDLDRDSRAALFAFCVSRSVNAVALPYDRRPAAIGHADRVSEVVHLDMAAEGWAPTVENYLGRVTKALILAAVREAKGAEAAAFISHLKKAEMAREAEALLRGTGWLPLALRTPGLASPPLPFAAEAADPDVIFDPREDLPAIEGEAQTEDAYYPVAAE